MLTKKQLEILRHEFISYLSQSNSSRSTVANYSSDLKRLISQLPETSPINRESFEQVLKNLGGSFSTSTIRRVSFSLKAFLTWLETKGYKFGPIPADKGVTYQKGLTAVSEVVDEEDLVEDYLKELSGQGASNNSLRGQKSDLFSFFRWLRPNLSKIDKSTTNRVSPFDINRYVSFLKSRRIPEASINRYLYSLRSFFNFSKEKVVYNTNPVRRVISNQTKTIGVHPRGVHFWQRFKIAKPRWWHAYRGHPMSDYLNWSALAVVTLLIGLGTFQIFFAPKPEKIDLAELKEGLVLAATPPRILSFQGRVTNASGTPITTATNFRFRIWDQLSGGTEGDCDGVGEDCMWRSATRSITPDSNGVFSAVLGDTAESDPVIPATLFSDNDQLWLGVTIGVDSEATPRQRIASSSYALNSDSLDGIDSLSFLRSDTSDNFTSGTLTTDDGTTLTINSTTIGVGNADTDTVTVNADTLFNADVDLTLAAQENLVISSTQTTEAAVNVFDLNFTANSAAGATTINLANINNADNTTNTSVPDTLLRLGNANAAETVPDGILIEQTGSGTLTSAIRILETAGTITDGITISSTLGNILNSGSIDITGAGAITGATAITSSGTITFSSYITDANGALYANPADGVVTRVAETETGSQCLLSGAGASGIPSWGSCPGGGVTWNTIGDATADGAIEFASTLQTMDWTNSATDGSYFVFNFDNNDATAGTDNFLVINNALSDNTGAVDLNTENLLLIQQLDTTTTGTTVVDNALKIDSAGSSAITDAIEITNSAGNITNGINLVDTGGGTFATGINFSSGTFTTGIDLSGAATTNDIILDDGLVFRQAADNLLEFVENGVTLTFDFNNALGGDMLLSTSGVDFTITATGGNVGLWAQSPGQNAGLAAGSGPPTPIADGDDVELSAEDDTIVNLSAAGSFRIDAATNLNSTVNGAAVGMVNIALNAGSNTAGQTQNGLYIDYETIDNATSQTQRAVRIDFTNTEADAAETAYALSLNNVSTAGAAIDALIALENNDATASSVVDGIVFLAGGAAAPDFTTGINFDAADFTQEIVLENAEEISNQINGTVVLERADAGALTLSLVSDTSATISTTTGNLILNSAGTVDIADAGIIFSAYTTDANAVLYTHPSTSVVTRVVETETGSQCLLSGAGASGVPTWGSCSGGSTSLQNAYDAGNTILTDASGDIIFQTIGGATDTQFEVNAASAPEIDMVLFSNAAQGISTTGVDGLQIDFETAGTTASADNAGLRVNVTSNNSGTTTTLEGIYIGNLASAEANSTETALRIGTGWDVGISIESGGLTISGGNLTYTGSARPTKIITLSPEYEGAVLDTDGSSTVDGSMTSDNADSGTAWRNYYQWTSTNASNQDYTVMVRITLPQDFSSWATGSCPGSTCALEIAYQTGLAATTNNGVSAIVNNDTDTPGTAVCTISEAASTSWTTFGCASTTLDDASAPEWDAAGETAVIRIKLKANSTVSALARVGDIKLRYLASF